MSIEIVGNNSYDVPVMNTSAGSWAEGIDSCSPLFRGLALSGLSAICHGISQSPEAGALDTLEFGDLFDESGKFVGDALSSKITPAYNPGPAYAREYAAGVHVTRAAFTASRLFNSLDVITDDYTGQTGVAYIRRRVQFPVLDPREAGRVMNTHPLRNVQVRVHTEMRPNADFPYTELGFAAALYGPGELERSTAISLHCATDMRTQSSRAQITGGERQGDFVCASGHIDFYDLSKYADVADVNV